jgi:uncharacterized protein YjlB
MLPDTLLDPISVGRRQLGDRPDGEGGDRIAVQLGDALDQPVGSVQRRLEQRGDLAGGLDGAFPAVDGAAGLKDVDAGVTAVIPDP